MRNVCKVAVCGSLVALGWLVRAAEISRDVVIYGSSPAALTAAVAARQSGKTAVIVSPETRIGGLTTGGLGQTDIGNKAAFGGLALRFYRDVAEYYHNPSNWFCQTLDEYMPDGQCAGSRTLDSMWTFEPSAALKILEGWVVRYDLDVRRGERLMREQGGVTKTDGRIVAFRTLSGNVYRGKMFVDATYEGDLMAAAGVSYAVGREDNSVYGETLSGTQVANAKEHNFVDGVDPYVLKGDKSSGLLPGVEPGPVEPDGTGDRRVQAYCFRMCLTDLPANRIPFARPAGYDERLYELLFRSYEAGEQTASPPWINSRMPNRKTDTNNCRGFSTDFIGQNWDWAEADYATRDRIRAAHLDYQRGLMWTLANHPRVPEAVRREVSRWGTCKDEFADGLGDGWQTQLYVREARRLVGDYVMTEANCRGQRVAARSVAMGAYTMDSHHVRRYVTAAGFVRNEGDVQVRSDSRGRRLSPYEIDYGALIPKRGECANLFVPVCLSASHIAFGSIRMEPVFFALGQAAGTAAAQAIDANVSVQDLPYLPLRARLLADGQVLSLPPVTSGFPHTSFYSKIDTVAPVWRADLLSVEVEKRGGAEGDVKVVDNVLVVEKRNAVGSIVIRAKPFPVEKGRVLRFIAEVGAQGAKWRQCQAGLRAYGSKENLDPSPLDYGAFLAGGKIINRELVNTTGDDFVRKIELFESKEGFATPVIVVSGEPSTSTWRNWRADDRDAADAAWKRYVATVTDLPAESQIPEAELMRKIAADVDHTAKIGLVDGYSRLFLDGKPVVPYVYHGDYIENCGSQAKQFRGGILAKNGVPLMTVSVRLGPVGISAGAWTTNGLDVAGIVRDVKDAMRRAPDSPFLLALGVVAYPEFIEKEHPDEAWIKPDGTVLKGSGSSSTSYCDTSVGDDGKTRWPWPSLASPAWRSGVSGCIVRIVDALQREGLAKRIVGIHFFGYHDCQFTVSYGDYSKPAKAEYLKYIAEPGHLSTNYEFFCRQLPSRIVNEFARTFKRAMAKDVIAIRWLESPNRGDPSSSWDIGEFNRSDALDVFVCQPWYEHRQPAMCCGSHIPFSSLHLHGKMFWDEIDFRNYAAFEKTVENEMDFTGIGSARDFDEWTRLFEKEANIMTGNRMGFWFLDKMRGAVSTPEIAAGIGREVAFRKRFEEVRASAWRPSAAFVVDEMALHGWAGEEVDPREGYRRRQLYFDQVEFLKAAGVPFEIYLAEDVLEHPERLAHTRLTVLAHFRKIDEVRRRFIDAMRTDGRIVIALPDTGRIGGKPTPAEDLVMIDQPMGLKPAEFNRLARKAGAYVALPSDIAQVTANGEFLALHGLVGGTCDVTLPWGEKRSVTVVPGENLRFVKQSK